MAHGTTIVAVKRDNQVAIAGDGQVTTGDIVLKSTANKLRSLYNDRVIAGFAGAVADAITLFERFEGQLEKHNGQLRRASVELAKEWRMDRALRRLGDLSDRDREVVRGLAHGLVGKLLHAPTVRLKQRAIDGDGLMVAGLVRELFGLGIRDCFPADEMNTESRRT